MARRVVITGLGAITPVGNSVKEYWESLKAGKCGISPITHFDPADFKVKIAAEVKDFDPKAYGDAKSMRRMELFSQYAVAASLEALSDSRLSMEAEDAFRVGVAIGSGIGSLQAMEAGVKRMAEKGPGRMDPLTVPRMISNMAAGNVAIRFGLRGKNINVVTACATGTHCIGEAMRSIQYGDADVMLAGGAEAPITPFGVGGFTVLTALSENPDPGTASRPFDKNRDGFVMGEGAGVLVLEELEHARKRRAHIYAELLGYGATCDAYHITSPAEDGSGAARAMQDAMKDAGLSPEEIDYINAHGTSTPLNDLFETRAIRLAFGDAAGKLRINSTKSMIGHLLGAAGGVEAIACVKSIEEGYVHVTRGLTESEQELDLDYCRGSGCAMDIRAALSNSLGFGGHNASLVIGKYRE
ncbi:MAG: beta-ketoacyl-ACP synthase II [Eubacteriales bacterium]|nr:beta-ketoacyl-ACP synthase II [Eubacteriales bacterium]